MHVTRSAQDHSPAGSARVSQEKPPRVALVAPGEVFGGAERQILALTRALQERDVDLILCLFHDGELARIARARAVPTTILGARGLVDIGSLERLRRTVHEHGSQVLHIHGYRAAVYCALAFRPGRFAVVKTEHGGVESHGVSLRTRLKPTTYRWLENRAARHLRAHVVYVTEDLRTRCRREHAGSPSSVIYNGIEPLDDAQTRRPDEYEPGAFNIAAVGRLEPVKGLEYAVRAMARSEMPADVRLHIIGMGPLQPRLEQLVRELRVDERVRLVGFRSNVYDYIAHASALLMPSLHEGLPYTVLEAMALGTPVLASRAGGLAEVLTHERTALLFDTANEAAIASTVCRLRQDRALAESLTAHARQDCAERFSAAAMADRYLELFRAVARRTS